MKKTIRIFIYGCISLSVSTELWAASTFFIVEQSLRRVLQQSSRLVARDIRFDEVSIRRFSSAVKDWNTGHVPAKRHIFKIDDGNKDGRVDLIRPAVQREEIAWHFDPVRSLYYYYIKENSVVRQAVELKQPIKQDDDMVVYALPSQKKSLKFQKLPKK